MKGCIPIEIPTKKYIKGFIISQLGEKPLMNRGHMIGSKLYDLLDSSLNEDRLDFAKSRYNDRIRIYISMHTFRQRGHCLNETNVKNFNRFLEHTIKDRFYFLMDFYMELFPSFEGNLPEVRKKLGIDDEHWLDDSMKKDYYRYRIESGKPLLYKKNNTGTVPAAPLATFAF